MAKPVPWLVPAVWTGGCVPAALMVYRAANHELGANPISTALNQLGLLALTLLMLTLACTPLQQLFKWTWPPRIRRQLGLLTFGYASAHLLTYACLDLGLDFATLGADIAKRPFITVGFSAWLLMVPLALTSTDAMVKRLGYVKWKRLHRLSYFCAGLGVIHFIWRVKKDVSQPMAYAAVLAVLLAVRAIKAKKPARSAER
jgi:sulfoxide reductase heme-binding subunit YedZ